MRRWLSTSPSACLSNTVPNRRRRDIDGFVALDIPSRRRYVANKAAVDYPSVAHDKFRSVCTAFGGYTEFGIAPEPQETGQMAVVGEISFLLIPTPSSLLCREPGLHIYVHRISRQAVGLKVFTLRPLPSDILFVNSTFLVSSILTETHQDGCSFCTGRSILRCDRSTCPASD